MNDFLISHQQQPCGLSCFATCMAMLMARPAEVVREHIHNSYREKGLSLGEVLDSLELPFSDFKTAGRNNIDKPGVWVAAVPSLNLVGIMHQVLVEVLPSGVWAVFDPNEGKEGKKFYTAAGSHDFPLAVQFTSGYTVEAFISREDLAAYRAKRSSEAAA